jgi:DNA repair protein RecO (recombination protein O)
MTTSRDSAELGLKTAVILHQYPYRNSSLILQLFLQDYGKVSAVAKGIKKSRKNDLSLLQPFQTLVVSLTGRNELKILKSYERGKAPWVLQGKRLYCAYYINELLLRLLPAHTDCQPLFKLYEHLMELLAQVTDEQNRIYEPYLRLFELKLLSFLGYGLNLTEEIHTGKHVESDKQYHYMIDAGPSEAKPETGSKCLLIRGETLLKLADQCLDDTVTLQQSKQLLKWALAEHLGDKPLKSRELYKQLYCQ